MAHAGSNPTQGDFLMTCAVANCKNDVIARGLCHKHYKRWQINGHTGITNGKGCTDPHERFRFLTKREANGCLEWQGPMGNSGYGQTKWRRVYFSAHKFSWTLHKGAVPDGLFVCHRCNNKRCVDPDHLYLGTQSQNTQDAIASGLIKTGERHPLSKLTDVQVAEARDSLEPKKQLAARFGVHTATIYKAMKRRPA